MLQPLEAAKGATLNPPVPPQRLHQLTRFRQPVAQPLEAIERDRLALALKAELLIVDIHQHRWQPRLAQVPQISRVLQYQLLRLLHVARFVLGQEGVHMQLGFCDSGLDRLPQITEEANNSLQPVLGPRGDGGTPWLRGCSGSMVPLICPQGLLEQGSRGSRSGQLDRPLELIHL